MTLFLVWCAIKHDNKVRASNAPEDLSRQVPISNSLALIGTFVKTESVDIGDKDFTIIHRQVVENIEVTVETALSEIELSHLDAKVVATSVGNSLVIQLKAKVVASKDVHHHDVYDAIRVPDTWWDHFKETYFPKFLLCKFPVQYTTYNRRHTFETLKMCPHIQTKGMERHLEFLRVQVPKPRID